jgi:hypothetical protein
VRLIEAKNLAGLECDGRFWIPEFFAIELNAALLDQASRIGA